MIYRHFLLTRFNIPINSVRTRQLDQIDVARDTGYLTARFALFEKYTVPSVKQQTCRRFTWLVLLSAQTPDAFRARMEAIAADCPVCRPVYIEDDEDSNAVINTILHEQEADYYVTSRVDNDDALGLHYIADIQHYVNQHKDAEYALIFENGMQYEEKNGLAVRYHFPLNHFSTYVERAANQQVTILHFNHMELKKHVQVISLRNRRPQWLEVVHRSNVTNRMHFTWKDVVFDADLKELFAVDAKTMKGGQREKLSVLLLSLLNRPANAVRVLHQYGIKKTVHKILGKVLGRLAG